MNPKACQDKQAVWLEGRNQIQFYQDPLTIDMVIPHIDAHFQKYSVWQAAEVCMRRRIRPCNGRP